MKKKDLQELLDALRAARDGEVGMRLSAQKSGVMGDVAQAFNSLAERREGLTDELGRVSKVIGREGRMTERAKLKNAKGSWADSVDSVNSMIDDLVRPTIEVSRVLDAVAEGDLSQKMSLKIEGQPVRGEFLRIGTTVNTMLDQLSSFASEVTRVAREVGTEGILGGQARVKDVSGIWRDLTDNVNFMANNLTTQVRNIAEVTTAVANGDLSKKITVDVKGEVLELKNTINTMVDQLGSFADEVTRVAREVGTEGKLGGQATVKGVSGTWKDLTDNVNFMATNLTTQVRGIAKVVSAVADGNLNQKFTIEAKGEVAALADTINSMIDTLRVFAEQVTTVARQVGTEGKLGGQAEVPGVAGTWRALTDNVNGMAANLTDQVRNIADVTTAVAKGDLSRKITVDAKGEVLRLKNTINTMVDQLSSFAAEVTRVAKEVGTEGRLGGQAEVKGVSGTWRELTDNVNQLADNLTNQVRNIADVTTAVAKGDLTRTITVDARGEILELKNTINTMVDQLSAFADEVTRVAREVGTEGILGGEAKVPGVSGTWKALTDNVNFMANNLTTQVRNIAEVTTAVATGDLSKKITVGVKGEVLELKNTINTMVDQLSSFADEVTRVAREVGTDGRLGGQAQVKGVSGTWKDLTDNVNTLADNLTDQVRNIADVTTAVANGDLSKKITVDARGEVLELKETINTMVDQLRSFAAEVTRVAKEVGTEGRLGGQANVEGVSGTWKDLTDNVNTLADNLTTQVRNIAEVTTAVATGDLSKKITVDVKGEILQLKNTINTMVDQLSSFADEVTRVAREVGTEGKLGGQAKVKGVSGTWKDLTDNVNQLADNLTNQVRNIAEVTTAVAKGELSKKITVDARGEILELKNTINTMVDQLSTFAAEVTRVAKEVGTEGKLGVQAQVQGVSGVWEGLTDNVNQLAGTLTTQLRAISEVSQAVTQGDLTRSIAVEAEGEVAELKDTINQMIDNLAETTRVNNEQDWLNSNMARFTGMLQGERDLETVSRLIMSELTPLVGSQHGAFFMMESPDGEGDEFELRLIATYGYKQRKNVPNRFKIGEALVGQAALEQKPIVITQAPDDYVRISSGLGEGVPVNVIVLPVLFEDQVLAVVELASFQRFSSVQQSFLEQLAESIGVVLNTIQANMRTEELLVQSQDLTQELQSQSEELQAQQEELQQTNKELEEQAASLKASEELLQTQQEELQQTNEELEEKAQLLEEQNRRIEIKNREIELARAALEEKAEQLSLSSRYKSEFLANMSHELRTPLNSLLILAKLLSENPESNLNEKQIEFAKTIYGAGSDLLSLINDILDLSKVEAGRMDVNVSDVKLSDLRDFVERSFRPVAEDKDLGFEVEVHGANVPPTIETDEQRLQQVIKNLLSNAFKFTSSGNVKLRIGLAEGRQFASEALSRAEAVLEFSVEDTGVGIPHDKLRLIFEAFQQADGTTSRRYGGTGLGLSISREIARLLGGEITVTSRPGQGSTFALLLPPRMPDPDEPEDEALPFAADSPLAAEVEELDLDPALLLPGEVPDDRDEVQEGDRVVLIVEDDPDFARTELEIARERGFKGIVALRGDIGLALAREYRPDAIVLDMSLPVQDGWTVLDRLKRMPQTRHIPVHIVSATDRPQHALRAGAVAVLEKPVSKAELDDAFTS
ncbi:MAG: HAMP domain-containing protein, partial [Gaiellaceae bacterium]